ncbi:MAG: HlyD family type I secretion periplasmic adaptor subunit [Pseudomonadota bacterium]
MFKGTRAALKKRNLAFKKKLRNWLEKKFLPEYRLIKSDFEKAFAFTRAKIALVVSTWPSYVSSQEDLKFADDVSAAVYEETPRRAKHLLYAIAALLLTFLIWSCFAQLEQVARGEGQVIPSSKTQVVQSLEAGIIKGISAQAGDSVKKGQMLLQIDDTGFSSSLGELRAKEAALLGQVQRLRVEISDTTASSLTFPDDFTKRAPNIVQNELQLFQARRKNLNNQISILEERLRQKELQLIETQKNIDRLQRTLDISQSELDLKLPLAAKGVIPKTQILQLQREMSDISGQLDVAKQSMPRLEAAMRESKQQIEEQILTFRQTAQGDLNERLSDLSVVQESLKAAKDKVFRTDIRSPVDGIVNKLNITTVGGVIKPGETLLEIVPLEDNLLIEARIAPKDIAFITAKQKAMVKITAYDFSIYGGLDGTVERVSPNSSYDEISRQYYYIVTVKTSAARLTKGKEELPIIPGMVASVDIITGKRSVFNILTKPISKARYEALREP